MFYSATKIHRIVRKYIFIRTPCIVQQTLSSHIYVIVHQYLNNFNQIQISKKYQSFSFFLKKIRKIMSTELFSKLLSQNYIELLEDNEYYDVTIEVGEDPNVKIF